MFVPKAPGQPIFLRFSDGSLLEHVHCHHLRPGWLARRAPISRQVAKCHLPAPQAVLGPKPQLPPQTHASLQLALHMHLWPFPYPCPFSCLSSPAPTHACPHLPLPLPLYLALPLPLYLALPLRQSLPLPLPRPLPLPLRSLL